MGDAVLANAYTMDMYAECRARHAALIKYEQEKK
jgi:hypothetical protein